MAGRPKGARNTHACTPFRVALLLFCARLWLEIWTKAGGAVALAFNRVQLYLLARSEQQRRQTGHVRTVVLGCRQPGISTWGYGERHRRPVRAINFGSEPGQPMLFDSAWRAETGSRNPRAEMWIRPTGSSVRGCGIRNDFLYYILTSLESLEDFFWPQRWVVENNFLYSHLFLNRLTFIASRRSSSSKTISFVSM